ncbi:tRNA (adenosine(37)-N6)-threonylcarbamoyltransferase complex ATPase subunit type 1 TsaE [Rhodoferax sp.]|uniref:tRNA (adenosine(37)-N6)-threonylcarbamoyltransferase complex ATPase subunit type 1 TsaE n=1 Tax=Rhodoferax sp. TaxID=50421 RepID=UPI00374CBFC5
MRIEVSHPLIVKSLLWPDETATQRFAAALASAPALRNAFVELQGELGSGKTTLVRYLLRALGLPGRVKSPTYAVVEPYELTDLQLNVWHFDFYRFSDPREWEDAGFRDIFASKGLKLAEWPQKAVGFLPRADLIIELEAVSEASRQVGLTAQTAVGLALLQAVSRDPSAPALPVSQDPAEQQP